ncbi:MAG TPA: hypothetical protein VFS47_10330 [Steroidobacteraceae bacterium]|nr:hypothetical protein [Steroidobacteraceae bacterium]
MREHRDMFAGLETVVVNAPAGSATNIVMLHGYSMSSAALSPFAHSLGVNANFYFPQAPQRSLDGGWTWWHVDAIKRAQALAMGPRNLAHAQPERQSARRQICALISEIKRRNPHCTIVCGFSQGGMLILDAVLLEQLRIDGLALFSCSLIDRDSWAVHADQVRNLPTFISHGYQDPDLAFDAGCQLRDFLLNAGAQVEWVPFEGRHEIPLPVWRRFKQFAAAQTQPA